MYMYIFVFNIHCIYNIIKFKKCFDTIYTLSSASLPPPPPPMIWRIFLISPLTKIQNYFNSWFTLIVIDIIGLSF